jgi:DnaJ-class molecular chaperone
MRLPSRRNLSIHAALPASTVRAVWKRPWTRFERSYLQLKSQMAAGPGSGAAPAKPAADGAGPDSTTALYTRVGLAPDAPDFVLEAARRAFARRFHPDSAASRKDPDASSAEFRYFMRIFDVLQERRKRNRP